MEAYGLTRLATLDGLAEEEVIRACSTRIRRSHRLRSYGPAISVVFEAADRTVRDHPNKGSGQGIPRSGGLFGRNKEPTYDFDAEGADDERTPLVGTVRTPRRYARRITSSNGGASIDEYYGVRRESRCRKLGGAVLGVCIFAVVILSAVAFLVMSNRPMYDVYLGTDRERLG